MQVEKVSISTREQSLCWKGSWGEGGSPLSWLFEGKNSKMIRSVKAKRLVKKRFLAKQHVGKLMDNLIGKVVRSVEGKLARVNTVVRTSLEMVKEMKEDDLR